MDGFECTAFLAALEPCMESAFPFPAAPSQRWAPTTLQGLLRPGGDLGSTRAQIRSPQQLPFGSRWGEGGLVRGLQWHGRPLRDLGGPSCPLLPCAGRLDCGRQCGVAVNLACPAPLSRRDAFISLHAGLRGVSSGADALGLPALGGSRPACTVAASHEAFEPQTRLLFGSWGRPLTAG